MAIPLCTFRPDPETGCATYPTEGELIEIPGKSRAIPVFADSDAQDEKISIFNLKPLPTDEAVHFYHHEDAYTAFVVWSGRFEFWNGDKGHELGSGDFAFIPPNSVYGFQSLEEDSELLVFTTLDNHADLFESIGHGYSKILHLDSSDIHVIDDYHPPELINFIEPDSDLPTFLQPYFLRVTSSPRWIFGGVMSRPCVRSAQCEGKFSISAMESSHIEDARPFGNRWLSFTRVDHCFCVIEGVFRIKFKDDDEWSVVEEGQAIVVSARQYFSAEVGSDFTRIITLANGPGIDELVCKAGSECDSVVLPEVSDHHWDGWDEIRFKSACVEVGALVE
ncbi:hypothetical protein FDECE_5282 [Fusarium decemcellulare]|uniref:Uncharacterized protein n=1 Tax=Fusarium decemcellulare TaxID=57161 RepID=A0ACC1RTD2_9HYPO|nr:hypothetical protein FDECE_5282 [Fusarium decemcellulare]KAJ3526021.1 hypothetical protein NM208_g11386 [Fusarium decemcellulare]